MTVENDDSRGRKYPARLCSVSDAFVNVVKPLPQPFGVEHRMDSSEGVRTRRSASSSQRFQKRARPTCSQALMLPNLAQNSTSDDFTTAAVGKCAASLYGPET